MNCSLPGSSCPWGFPGKSTGVGCHFPSPEEEKRKGIMEGLEGEVLEENGACGGLHFGPETARF